MNAHSSFIDFNFEYVLYVEICRIIYSYCVILKFSWYSKQLNSQTESVSVCLKILKILDNTDMQNRQKTFWR